VALHIRAAEKSLRLAIDLCVAAKRSGSVSPHEVRRVQRKLGMALDQVSGTKRRSFRPAEEFPQVERVRAERKPPEQAQPEMGEEELVYSADNTDERTE